MPLLSLFSSSIWTGSFGFMERPSPYNRIKSSSATWYFPFHPFGFFPDLIALFMSDFSAGTHHTQSRHQHLSVPVPLQVYAFPQSSHLLAAQTDLLERQTREHLANIQYSSADLDPLPFARTLLCTPRHQPTQSLDTYCSLRLCNRYLSLVKPPCQVRLQLRLSSPTPAPFAAS